MRRIVCVLTLAATLAAVGCASNSPSAEHHEWRHHEREQEQKITLDQAPAAVQATINREAEGGAVTEIKTEQEGGKTAYIAEVKISGNSYKVKVAADGTLLVKKNEMEDHEGNHEGKDEDQGHNEDKD